MKKKLSQSIEIPQGITCSYQDGVLKCSKGSMNMEKEIRYPGVEVVVEGTKIVLDSQRGNKNQHKSMMTFLAHIKNIFIGLDEEFVYHLEACNVHFPMTLKVNGNDFVINNFLGEKTPRHAKIVDNVKVEIAGQKITVTSHDKEAAGQTAANLEAATKIRSRDRRIFQDGIFITEKPRRKM